MDLKTKLDAFRIDDDCMTGPELGGPELGVPELGVPELGH